MPRPEQLSATALRNAVIRYRDVLRVHQEELNDLNVYPVPDGDSGTNLRLTLDSVVEELDGAADMLAVCRAISKGALRGARGNSGVILSQILHGIAKVLAGTDAVGGDDLARALRKGTDAAYDAVSAPKEGTILTVVREAAEASASVLEEHPEATFADVLERAAEAAREALARTPEMLPELREAGVVDSGGKGATLLLEALLAEAEGRPVPGPETFRRPEALDDYSGRRRFSPKYEVMFFLETDDFAVARLKKAWSGIGDSIIVAGEEGHYNCHIHTDDIGAVIEAAVDVGRPSEIQVADLSRQVRESAEEHRRRVLSGDKPDEWGEDEGAGAGTPASRLLAIAEGKPMRAMFEGLGADIVVDSPSPSVEELLSAVDSCDVDSVLILPNGEANAEAARAAGGRSSKAVTVVPTAAAVEGLAAITQFDPGSNPDANAGIMAEAASRVKIGRITGSDEAGWKAVNRHGPFFTAGTVEEAARRLIDHLVAPQDEVLILLTGAGAREEVTLAIRRYLEDEHPHIVAEIHEGGQSDPYLFGVE